MDRLHNVESVEFKDDMMIIEIDGKAYKFDLANYSKKLLNASKTERGKYEISPSGYGIHWPMIDEDLSIDGLIGIKHSAPSGKKAS